MPYYHVIIALKSRPRRGAIGADLLEHDLVKTIVKPYNKGEPFRCGDVIVSQDDISYIRISKSEEILSRDTGWLSSQTYFVNLWQTISQQEDVTEKFIKTLPQEKKEKIEQTKPFSKNIFIVHGIDHKPMKKLKAMLEEFGLNPIVLHEQPSASRTIVEKLEKYSDVGYAIVILTPDDIGALNKHTMKEFRWIVEETIDVAEQVWHMKAKPPYFGVSSTRIEGDLADGISRVSQEEHKISPENTKETRRKLSAIRSSFRYRARQNVVLEFGYFVGLLNRDRVCCLYKGDVELPSDMQGIVYIPFKNSVNEAREMIIKELKEAGYEIKL